MSDFIKPTVEQVSWVFRNIIENAGKGTFRYLIYDKMGFEEKDYYDLYVSGGMAINNAMLKWHEGTNESDNI